MPMCVEGAVAMLACARIGAIHSVVFGGVPLYLYYPKARPGVQLPQILTSDALDAATPSSAALP
jgi:hypothetical protein